MGKKGFTLVELLATVVVLAIITSLTIVGVNASLTKAKNKTEDIFVKTINDAIGIYIDSDAKNLNFGSDISCVINKTRGSVNVYKATNTITFDAVGKSVVFVKILAKVEYETSIEYVSYPPVDVVSKYDDITEIQIRGYRFTSSGTNNMTYNPVVE